MLLWALPQDALDAAVSLLEHAEVETGMAWNDSV